MPIPCGSRSRCYFVCTACAAALAVDRAAVSTLGTAERLGQAIMLDHCRRTAVNCSSRLATAPRLRRAAVGSLRAARQSGQRITSIVRRTSYRFVSRCGLRAAFALNRAAIGILHATRGLAERLIGTDKHSTEQHERRGDYSKHEISPSAKCRYLRGPSAQTGHMKK